MTINKSQGQTLSTVEVYLQRPVFTHGQLYVAMSRVKSKNRLKYLIEDEDDNCTNETKNVVYKEVFSRLETGNHC
jgi:ATP-dependent DNA helicase PIF1